MPLWLVLAHLSTPPAAAVGGALVGPLDGPVAASGGTAIVVAPDGEGRAEITVTARVDREVATTALLWPAPGVVATSVGSRDPIRLDALEGYTRPRLQRVTCDDAVDVRYVHTVDGCRTYDARPEPVSDEPTFAVDEVPWDAVWAEVAVAAEVLEPAGVDSWLLQNDLVAPAGFALVLQDWIDRGTPIVAARTLGTVAAGEWLPPVRFEADVPRQLPLTLGAADAERSHDVWVFTLDAPTADALMIVNYPERAGASACMVPQGDTLGDVYDLAVAELVDGALPAWMVEYSGPAASCDPCTSDPLQDLVILDLGRPVPAAETWVKRDRMRYATGQLDQDPELGEVAPPVEEQLVWTQYDADLEFTVPLCDGGIPDNPGTCPGVALDGGTGCSLGSRAPVGLVALAVALLAVRRRRATPVLVAAGLLLGPQARAAERKDVAPRTEIHAALPVWSTERVVLDGLERGAPFIGNPLLGLEVRRVLVGWRDGANVGVIAGVRGFRGRARSPASPVRFVLVEPSVGLDGRHGRFREGRVLSPKVRYGAQLATTVVDSSVYRPRATVGAMFLAGAGAWVGKGPRQWSLEARTTVVPRTDGYDTRFLPDSGIPGWQYSAGSAVVQLLVGVGLN